MNTCHLSEQEIQRFFNPPMGGQNTNALDIESEGKIKYKENEINLITDKLPTRAYKNLKLVLAKIYRVNLLDSERTTITCVQLMNVNTSRSTCYYRLSAYNSHKLSLVQSALWDRFLHVMTLHVLRDYHVHKIRLL